jgi:hypothetical protein
LCELVIASCDAPEILEPAEATFNDVAAFVGLLVMADFLFAVEFTWNNGLDALFLQKGSDCIGVVAFVSEQFFDAGEKADALFRHHTVSGVAGRENKDPGTAEFVDDRVDFAVLAALRKPDRLKIRPPFPPWAQR